jgi:hypothetical protein
MWFVPTKTVEHQSCLTLHCARHLFIRQQTVVINSIRAYLAEFRIERMSKTGSLRTGAGIRLIAERARRSRFKTAGEAAEWARGDAPAWAKSGQSWPTSVDLRPQEHPRGLRVRSSQHASGEKFFAQARKPLEPAVLLLDQY